MLSVVVTLGSMTTGPAFAATTVGATFVPPNLCPAGITYAQTPSPVGTPYAVDTAGVITSWRFQASAVAPTLKFKVFRPTGGNSYTVVGSSEQVLPAASTLSSFPIRVPVEAGDIIGMAVITAGPCAGPGSLAFVLGDQPVGSNQPYTADSGTLDIAATVEPDGDKDGFGDETQDLCATQATTQGACDLDQPSTTITKGPQSSTRTTVRFIFVSDEPAVFECRLKGNNVRSEQLQQYRPCSSPKRFKHLKVGRYMFQARAIDEAGNRDRTPDKWKFRVKAR